MTDASNDRSTTITLETPLKLGETEITDLTLRRPCAGDMRGLTVRDLMQGDYNAIAALTSRICSPTLTEMIIGQMDASDFASLSGEVMGFFMSSAQKKAIMAHLGMETQTG